MGGGSRGVHPATPLPISDALAHAPPSTEVLRCTKARATISGCRDASELGAAALCSGENLFHLFGDALLVRQAQRGGHGQARNTQQDLVAGFAQRDDVTPRGQRIVHHIIDGGRRARGGIFCSA